LNKTEKPQTKDANTLICWKQIDSSLKLKKSRRVNTNKFTSSTDLFWITETKFRPSSQIYRSLSKNDRYNDNRKLKNSNSYSQYKKFLPDRFSRKKLNKDIKSFDESFEEKSDPSLSITDSITDSTFYYGKQIFIKSTILANIKVPVWLRKEFGRKSTNTSFKNSSQGFESNILPPKPKAMKISKDLKSKFYQPKHGFGNPNFYSTEF